MDICLLIHFKLPKAILERAMAYIFMSAKLDFFILDGKSEHVAHNWRVQQDYFEYTLFIIYDLKHWSNQTQIKSSSFR